MSGIADITFAPLLPWWSIIALGVGALIIVAFALYRRAAGVGWRALFLAAGVLVLTNPSLVEEEREPLDDVALIVVDKSPSQSIGDRHVRTDGAAEALEAALAAQSHLETRVVTVGAAGGEDDQSPSGPVDGTRLFGAIEQALSDVPSSRLAGVILLTDGQVHDAPTASAEEAIPAPVHVLLTGEMNEVDRRLTITKAPAFGIVGQSQSLTLVVEEPGGAQAATSAVVRVRRDGGNELSNIVPIGRPYTVTFELPHGGSNLIEVDVEAGPRELTLQNNRAVVVINGVRDRLRVLLVSGEPHAGERVWRNLLKADPAVDLVHFTILRPPEKQDGTPINELSLIAFPIRQLFEIKLHEFDLIIFDRYRMRGVLPRAYLTNISQYVQDGGALLEAAGPAFASPLSLYRTPLSRILPGSPTGLVLTEGFRPSLTGTGERHPVTGDLAGAAAEDAPAWGRWFRMIEVERESGNALMAGIDGRPLLILDRVGEGRVAQLLSDHAWLWARGFEGGGPQAEMLRRLAHWLMKEPDLEEEDLRAAMRGGRLEIVRRSLEPDPSPVTVTAPSGRTFEVTLEEGPGGRAVGSVVVNEPGLYRLDDGTRHGIAAVGPVNPKEFADPRTTDAVLQPVVDATGGGTFWLGERGVPDVRRVDTGRRAAGRSWLGLHENNDYIVTGVKQMPLMPAIVALAVLLGSLLLAWRREGA